MDQLYDLIGILTYGAQGIVALWGAYCAVMAWRRVANVRFRDEAQQDEFLDELDQHLLNGEFDGVIELCEGDRRAMPQLALHAIERRDLPFPKLRRQLTERFQQDVLADLEHRLSWVGTAIKSEPMLGLFGTVIGMMYAFSNLATGTEVDTGKMAENISFALITTAVGLAIAMPLVIVVAAINVRIRKMEDLVASGLARLLETMQTVTQYSRSR
jgi:biopolymer transport protein ExbB